MKLRRIGRMVVLCLPIAVGCEGSAPPAEPAAPPAPPPAPAAAKPAETANPLCVGPIGPGVQETVKAGGKEWQRNGSTLTYKGDAKSLVIGALTDIKEPTEENKANLKAFVAWFKQNKVDLIVVAGDTGATRAEIEAALDILAQAGVPVLNIVGNREPRDEYRAAMEAVRAKHPHVLDLNQIRRVDTPAVDIVSMPGYYDRTFIHPEDGPNAPGGCPYFPADVEALAGLVKQCDSPVLLVSHGGPRQDGANAIDYVHGGKNVGDPSLKQLIESAKIPFGLFGNVHEAGGRATDLAGATVLEEGKPYEQLYLNPGPADAVRWEMNDKSESLGMAALLTVSEGKATYRIHRMGKKVAAKGKGGGKKRK